MPTPSFDTKDHRCLKYQLVPSKTVLELQQDNTSSETGATLWLAAQVSFICSLKLPVQH